MTSKTTINLTGEDSEGDIHEIIIRESIDNSDWFFIETKMEQEMKFESICFPKVFISDLIKALTNIKTS